MTAATVATVPNAEGTPRRTIRVADDLWDGSQAKVAEQTEPVRVTFTVEPGGTVSDVVRAALEQYLAEE